MDQKRTHSRTTKFLSMAAKPLVIILLLLSTFGCNQPFDPKGPVDQQMVVFAVFSTDRDVQYVTVDMSYMPSGFDPLTYTSDNALNDVFVTLKDSRNMYQLRDTALARLDTSRYKSPLRLYALYPFTVRQGQTYQLVVQSRSMGVASATVVVPGKALLDSTYSARYILIEPFSHFPEEKIRFPSRLSSSAKGYLARLTITYDVLKGTEWVQESVELPIATADTAAYSLEHPIYPQIAPNLSAGVLDATYRNGFLINTIKNLILAKYADNRMVFKWIVFTLIQLDQNLFNYYSVVHDYRDPRTVRLDRPMYSEINGGIGFVGACTVDSLVFLLPTNFSGNR